MVTSKKDKNNQEISRQKPPRGDPYKIRTTGKGRPVVPVGAGDAMAPPDFGRSVNTISTRGWGQIMPTTLLPAPPDFQKLLRPYCVQRSKVYVTYRV